MAQRGKEGGMFELVLPNPRICPLMRYDMVYQTFSVVGHTSSGITQFSVYGLLPAATRTRAVRTLRDSTSRTT
jgi:hypothetical protein